MNENQYINIKEVSKILNIKEHVIRHWDSIDPKTNKIRFKGISTRSKGGTRYFNKENIKKLQQIKNLLFENGKHNYSLDLVNKIISTRKNKILNFQEANSSSKTTLNKEIFRKLDKLKVIANKLRNLGNL